ncbi:MAG TPA: hypothetical protein VGG70_11215 [Candidatus Cybelea sp.]
MWGGLFLVLGPLRAPGDGDLYWQRWLGELVLQTHRLPTTLGNTTFTAAGAAWIPQEWLFSVAVALARDYHAFLVLSILVSALPLAILFSIYWRSRAESAPEAIGIVLLICGVAFLESFGARAQVLGWAALAVFMFFIERRDRWYYAALPAAVIWANLHASVAIAPAIVLARTAASFADGGLSGLRKSRDLVMLPLVVLATFCTPFGWRLPAFALALANSPIRHYIQEWQRPGWGDISFMLGALPIALAILLGGRTTLAARKLQSFPSALLFAATLFAARNITLFVIVAAPLAACGLQARFPQLRRLGSKFAELEPVGLPAIAIAVAASAFALARIQAHAPAPLPAAAISSLTTDGRNHRVFCENFTWCSVALQYPTLQVFIDGRCDGYPLAVWNDYVSTIRARKNWSEPLEKYGVGYVIAQRGSRLANAIEKLPHWGRSYEDVSYVVFRRD